MKQRSTRSLAGLVLCGLMACHLVSAASVMQLDVCNKHKGVSNLPAMSLTVKDGLCIVSGMLMAQPDTSSSGGTQGNTCGVSEADGAIVFKFPCQEKDRSAVSKTYGPALNLWTSMHADAAAKPAASPAAVAAGKPKASVITEKAAAGGKPAAQKLTEQKQQQQQHLRQPAPSKAAAAVSTPVPTGTCTFTTMNPGIYFHRVPPMYLYGYTVSKVPCDSLTAAQLAAAVSSVQAAGSGASQYSSNYGLWLLPSLPGPPKDFSEADQECHLVMSVANKSFQSLSTYPCKMTPVPSDQLGNGCCYDPVRKFRRSLFTFGSGISVSH